MIHNDDDVISDDIMIFVEQATTKYSVINIFLATTETAKETVSYMELSQFTNSSNLFLYNWIISAVILTCLS